MSKPLAYVPFPLQTAKTAARVLRGHRMGALKDGWLLVYEDLQTPPDDSIIDELCIVQTVDQQVLARFLKKGRRQGTWDLLTVTGDQQLDVELAWAQKVTLIVPYSPSPEEAERLGMAG